MTNPNPTPKHSPSPTLDSKTTGSSRLWSAVQFVAAFAAAAALLTYLVLDPSKRSVPESDSNSTSSEPIQLAGTGKIRIDPESTVSKKIESVSLHSARIEDPAITVTGTI